MTINLSLPALRKGYLDGSITIDAVIKDIHNNIQQHTDSNAWIYVLSIAELTPYINHLKKASIENLPLYGVPFAIKDNIDLADIPTTAACPDFSYSPTEHAYVVGKLIEAGAIPIGKTNLDQFATGLVGTRSPYGQGKNVFNPEYISGGSSAGSAIATALGQVSFALGTDTAGSGRVPAVLNNLIGHKPTKGLLSCTGVVPACKTLDCVSIFALTACDAATVLEVAANYDATDSQARPNTFGNKSRYFSGKLPAAFTFGVPALPDFYGNSECEQLFNKAVTALKDLGGQAVPIDFAPFIRAAKLLYEGPWVAERWLATQGVNLDSMLPEIKTIIGNGNKASAAEGFAAQYALAEQKTLCDLLVDSVDFMLTPTMPTFFKRSEIDADPIALNSVLGTYTNFMNLLDYSATAIPVGPTASGVHWGATLFTRAFCDIDLLNYAGAMQQHFNLGTGATGFALNDCLTATTPTPNKPSKYIDVVVCGAHLQGQPLNWQLAERGATLISQTLSSEHYQLYALSDGKRPAMVRTATGGSKIEVEVWRMPSEAFGSFVAGIPAPLGIGKVELDSGEWVSGFICDDYGLVDATNITGFGSWKAYLSKL